MNDFLLSIESSTLAQLMKQVGWLFPGAEIFHFIGLCLLIGSLLIVDIRLLGLADEVSMDAVYKFLPIAVLGFFINLLTGILFFFNDPFRYYPNIAFRIKLVLILLAGINALYFMVTAHRHPDLASKGDSKLKTVAALSLLLWFSVIVCGRMIPYVE
ncbi:MAG: hypothetical protein GKR93_14615 [Gammaproteobacteria bacterium]|nr:hypothetical protein [Gammaproteobacteria bacterium]